MIELERPSEPEELRAFRRKNPKSEEWGDPDFSNAKSAATQALKHAQEDHCAYCELPLDAKTGCHIDHIEPRSKKPQRVFDFENMVVSCSAKDHCGHKKGSQLLAVVPSPGVNRYFELAQDGQLWPAHGLTPQERADAEGSLRVLNLNVPGLARQRKSWLDLLENQLPDEAESLAGGYPFRWTLLEYLRQPRGERVPTS